jgi:hypothetical protein
VQDSHLDHLDADLQRSEGAPWFALLEPELILETSLSGK